MWPSGLQRTHPFVSIPSGSSSTLVTTSGMNPSSSPQTTISFDRTSSYWYITPYIFSQMDSIRELNRFIIIPVGGSGSICPESHYYRWTQVERPLRQVNISLYQAIKSSEKQNFVPVFSRRISRANCESLVIVVRKLPRRSTNHGEVKKKGRQHSLNSISLIWITR